MKSPGAKLEVTIVLGASIGLPVSRQPPGPVSTIGKAALVAALQHGDVGDLLAHVLLLLVPGQHPLGGGLLATDLALEGRLSLAKEQVDILFPILDHLPPRRPAGQVHLDLEPHNLRQHPQQVAAPLRQEGQQWSGLEPRHSCRNSQSHPQPDLPSQ